MATTKPFKRGSLPKGKSVAVTIPFPRPWETHLDRAISHLDTDRSKLVRTAVKEKLERMGINVPNLAA